MAPSPTSDVKEYALFRASARKAAYIDFSLIFTAIPISVILFDETCITSGGSTVCEPPIQDTGMFIAILLLLFLFTASKTLFQSKNFHLFHRANSQVPIIFNMLIVLTLVGIVWSAVHGKHLIYMVYPYIMANLFYTISSLPSLEAIINKKHVNAQLILLAITAVHMSFIVFIIYLAFENFKPSADNSNVSTMLIMISLYIIAASFLSDFLCRIIYNHPTRMVMRR